MNINVKRIALWLFVIMIASFSISGLLFKSSGLSFRNLRNLDEVIERKAKYKENINEEKFFEANSLNKIEINSISSDINVIPEERDDIKVNFHGIVASSNPIDKPQLITSADNNSLHIKIEHNTDSINIGFSSNRLTLDIYVPETYSKDISVGTISGDVDLEGLNISKFSYHSISGDLEGNGLDTNSSSLKSTSGDIIIKGFIGDLNYISISGDGIISYKDFNNNIDIRTTSGEVELQLPQDSRFNLNSKTTSGEIDCQFPLTIQGNMDKNHLDGKVGKSNNTIKINTVSGDVDIISK